MRRGCEKSPRSSRNTQENEREFRGTRSTRSANRRRNPGPPEPSGARQPQFAGVCVNPYGVGLVAAELAGSPVKVCTVIGFPLGATTTEAKIAETEIALRAGAQEIDMVMNVGALRSGDQETVRQDIKGVVTASHRAGAIVKTILETALLDDNQKAVACTLAKLAGADFPNTSPGSGPAG